MTTNVIDKEVAESDGFERLLSQAVYDDEREWCCLYTRPRHEKSLARLCRQEGLDYYLPLIRRVKRYKSGRKVRWLPLFPGYLFCYADEIEQSGLSTGKNLLGLLNVDNDLMLVEELREIYHALKVSKDLQALNEVKEGQEAEIIEGPFKGIKGVVCEVKNARKIYLNIHFIGRSTPLEVQMEDIEILS